MVQSPQPSSRSANLRQNGPSRQIQVSFHLGKLATAGVHLLQLSMMTSKKRYGVGRYGVQDCFQFMIYVSVRWKVAPTSRTTAQRRPFILLFWLFWNVPLTALLQSAACKHDDNIRYQFEWCWACMLHSTPLNKFFVSNFCSRPISWLCWPFLWSRYCFGNCSRSLRYPGFLLPHIHSILHLLYVS